MSCGCGKPKNRCVPNAYVDISCVEPKEWDDVSVLLGLTPCGEVTPVEKPLYITDGDGTLFLADDGTYKAVSATKIQYLTMTYYPDSPNFVVRNNIIIQEVLANIADKVEPILRLKINGIMFPLSTEWDDETITFSYNGYIYEAPISRAVTSPDYKEFTILIKLNTTSNPPSVINYEYRIDDVFTGFEITGDGDAALYNDGTYKLTYTKNQVDAAIDNLRQQIANDYVVYNYNNDIEARNNIILENDANLLGKTTTGGTINLIQCSRFTDEGHPITDIGSTTAHITLNSIDRPNIQLQGESGNHLHQVAYLSEVEDANSTIEVERDRAITAETQLQDNLDYVGRTLNSKIEQETSDRIESDNNLRSDITTNQNAIADLRDDVNTNTQSIIDLQTSTESAFEVVNNVIDAIEARVTTNEGNIAVNAQDIQSIRDDLNSRTALRGYFENTIAVLAIPNPNLGDYAYNAETDTIWAYDGSTWFDTTEPIPAGAVQASDAVPPVPNGTGAVGVATRFMRADAVIPQDPTKANLIDLDNYLPLSGNTQTSRMTGPIWISSGERINVSNSGNSYLWQNTSNNTTELVGNGVGGIDLIAANGPIKANGIQIADANQIESLNNGIFDLNRNLIETQGDVEVLTDRVSTNENNILNNSNLISANQIAIALNAAGISANTNDIQSILDRLAEEENFRGYKLTTTDVTSIANPQNGNYAYNVQTGTIWIYNGVTWADSLEPIPDGAIQASDMTPLTPSGSGDIGISNQYMRADAVIPSDPTKADALDLVATNNELGGLSNSFNNYVLSHSDEVTNIQTQITNNTNNISNLQTRVSTNEVNISSLQTLGDDLGQQVTENSTRISDAEGRIGVNEDAIISINQRIENEEHFKGGFFTTSELTATPATSGDFAWNYEDGFVWTYDASVPSWVPTTTQIPNSATALSDNLPLTNNIASAGISNEASRSDHIHASDPAKANLSDIPTSLSQLTNDSGYIIASDVAANYVPLATYNTLASRVDLLEMILNNVTGFWTGTQEDYDAINPKINNTYYHIYE